MNPIFSKSWDINAGVTKKRPIAIVSEIKIKIPKLNQNFKEVWKINNYNKKEKKLNPILYFAQIDNTLIVNDNLSKVYSVELNTGKILWSRYSLSLIHI